MKDVFVLPEKWCIRSNGQQMHEEIIEPYLVEKEYDSNNAVDKKQLENAA